VAVLLANVGGVGAGGFEDPQRRAADYYGEVATVSGVTSRGQSAGECGRTPSLTQVRLKPTTIDVRRDIGDAAKGRTFCILRT